MSRGSEGARGRWGEREMGRWGEREKLDNSVPGCRLEGLKKI